jgi:hypothetical protein
VPVTTTALPLPRWLRASVALAALSFVAATVWQIAAGRDDWPLSGFQMYSGLEGSTTHRRVVRGVSDVGEFALEGVHTRPLSGARLRHLHNKLKRQRSRREKFLSTVARRYDGWSAERGWPTLQAVRTYSEVWKIQSDLAGIDRPKRRLESSIYLPPVSLLDRLEAERAHTARPLAPRLLPTGDLALEFGEEHCRRGCREVDEELAGARRAIELAPVGGKPASATLELTLPAGRWNLFVRSLVRSGPGRVAVRVDGMRQGGSESRSGGPV